MSDYKSHGGQPIEFCGDQEGWIAVGSLSDDSPNSPCFPSVALLGVGLGPSGKEHPSNIAAMLTSAQTADLIARLTAAMNVDRPAPRVDVQAPPVIDLDALAEAERAMTVGPWTLDPTDDDIIAPDGAVKHPDGTTGNVVGYLYVEQDWNAIVALRNAAPHLIAEARAAVALRAELAAMAGKLAKAKRLGLEACGLTNSSEFAAIAEKLRAL